MNFLLDFIWEFQEIKIVRSLIIVVFTGLVSGLLIPLILRHWQNRQKELQLKTEIISDITESMMKTIMTIFLFKTRKNQEIQGMSDKEPQEEVYKIYKDWEVRGCMIGTKLHSYFPELGLRDKWSIFQKKVSKFYLDNKDINDKKDTEKLDKEIKKDLKLFDEKHKIIEEIIDSPMPVFRFHLRRKKHKKKRR